MWAPQFLGSVCVKVSAWAGVAGIWVLSSGAQMPEAFLNATCCFLHVTLTVVVYPCSFLDEKMVVVIVISA